MRELIHDSKLAPAAVRHGRSEAAVAGRLHRDPWLAAHVAHVAAGEDCTARRRPVQLTAVVRRDALAGADAVPRCLRAVWIYRATAGRLVAAEHRWRRRRGRCNARDIATEMTPCTALAAAVANASRKRAGKVVGVEDLFGASEAAVLGVLVEWQGRNASCQIVLVQREVSQRRQLG